MKPVKKFFVYKCKLSLVLLYLAYMFLFLHKLAFLCSFWGRNILHLTTESTVSKAGCSFDCLKGRVGLMNKLIKMGGDYIPLTSKIQLVVYHQCCVLIGWATTRLYVLAHYSETRQLWKPKQWRLNRISLAKVAYNRIEKNRIFA